MAEQAASIGQICVAPLSSPYSLLLRAHTYGLVVALLLPLPRGWLFRAALAAFTTRTAIFAVDAAVILHAVSGPAISTTNPIPLDAVVVLEILGLAVVVACWLLVASSRAGESSARPLIRTWAAVVTVGSILAFVSVAKLGKLVAAQEQATKITGGECGGIWMDVQDVFGKPETVPVLGLIGWKFAWVARRAGIPSLVFSVIALLGVSLPKQQNLATQIFDVEQNSLEVMGDRRGAVQRRLDKAKVGFVWLLWLGLPAMAVFIPVSTEQYLLTMTSNIPSVEKLTSVGQWGVWAATGAVLLATLINAVRGKMEGETRNTRTVQGGNEIVKL